ncbi:MAG: adenosylcobalamin-dependent ribonucleoside-diphosphate reductase [Candidatus Aenigmatarchaeota archaeon]
MGEEKTNEVQISKIIKRDGRVVDFDKIKIAEAIWKAAQAVGGKDKQRAYFLADKVVELLKAQLKPGEIPTVEQVQDLVEKVLVEHGHYKTAKAYILYRKEKTLIREEKKKILQKDFVDEVDKAFSLNAIQILASRYLLRDEEGRIVESPKQLFQRVAALIVIPDILHDPKVFDVSGGQEVKPIEDFDPQVYEGKIGIGELKWNRWHLERMKNLYEELNREGKMKVTWSKLLEMIEKKDFETYYQNYISYYELMTSKKFLPNSPTLFNAGTRLSQLSACFVLDVNDDMRSIMETAKEAALIFQSGGGIGVNWSKLRPEGDVVSSTGGIASGPISFMKIIDTITDVIKQGGKRRGACMGILDINHPDVEKFISVKETAGVLENFNISVLVYPEFMKAYEEDGTYELVNPRTGKVWKKVKARHLMNVIAMNAWKTGDPGMIFFDNLNRRNVLLKSKGPIRSTNPCGEEPLYSYESCNLGSINLYAHLKDDGEGNRTLDWDELKKTIRIAIQFLDNVIDVNKFPLEKIEKETKASRKIGLGIMGLADMLFALKIPYNSEEGFEMMSRVMEFITFNAMLRSSELAKERGVFPLFSQSSYPDEMPIEGFYQRNIWTQDWNKVVEMIKENGIRNAEVTTIAPTGSLSMLCDVSSGIEPQYALVFEKIVTIGSFYYTDVEFERQLKLMGLYEDYILKKIKENGGSIQGLAEIPEELRKVFVTALDIPWWDHVRAQAEITKWVCAATSKTINMPNWVIPDDVKNAFLFAYKLGCKGITIYRDGSKTRQVLYSPPSEVKNRQKEVIKLIKNKTLEILKNFGIEVYDFWNNTEEGPKKIKEFRGDICPECGSSRIVEESGCIKCLDCGWSTCVIS